MAMTPEVKQILSTKLTEAIEKEGLSKSKAAELLMLGNHNYASMACNGKQFDKTPKKVWIALQRWANSGESIRNYAKKRGFDLEFFEPEKKKAGRPRKKDEDNIIRKFIHAYEDMDDDEQKNFQYIMNKIIRL